MIMTGIIIALGIIIPFTPIGAYIGLVSLPGRYFIWLIGILIAYSLCIEVAKKLYIKRFDSWM
jgi:Mg2+-importing ATPase